MPQESVHSSPLVHRFGRFEMRPHERALLVDGTSVRLGGRAFDMLQALVERGNRIVGKRELMDAVWPKLVVEENNLQVQVMALRKVLGPAAIATVPGRGYRLTVAVATEGAVPAAGTAGASPAPSAVPATLAVPRTNAPAQLPPMFGRDEDEATVCALLTAHRMVSIVGAGGIGKTRLAQAVTTAMAAEFADGAWIVELASTSDPRLVASAVARVAGVGLASDRDAVAAVAGALAPQRMLLVLDNCEHVLDAVAELVSAIQRTAPHVRVLATSQEPLKAVDEHLFRLGTLRTPPADTEDASSTFSAVQLFVAAAKAADPRFALHRRNAKAVGDVCRRLDGIPLALELAAARVPLLGIEGLRARLDERFHLLTGGARTVLRRHQTLRGTLEWSHNLLTAEEQTVFRRLGVFAGSFTLEAVQTVVADATLHDWVVLEQLAALVDKSLVVVEGEHIPRYRLLETARAFALERLGESGETDEYLRRHAQAMIAILDAIPAAVGASSQAAFSLLTSELDNTRAALDWSLAAEDAQSIAVELHAASFRVWFATTLTFEGLTRCLRVRDLVDATIAAPVAARFWLTLSRLGMFTARAECYDAAQRAVEQYRALGNRQQLHLALTTVAAIAARRGANDAARQALDEAETLEEPAWSATQRAATRLARFMWAQMEGRYEDALRYAREQAALYRSEGGPYGESIAAGNIAAAEIAMGQPEVALERLQPAIARLEALGRGSLCGHLRGSLMIALADLGDHEGALEQARIAKPLLQREGDVYWMLEGLALLAAMRGRHAHAARVAGFIDATFARTGEVRRRPAAVRRERIDTLLAQSLAPPAIRDYLAEGAQLTEEQAFALALDA